MPDSPEVKVGQLWADNDPRCPDRYIRVSAINDGVALCEAWYDRPGSYSRTVRIRINRFKPTRTGYRLVSEVSDASS